MNVWNIGLTAFGILTILPVVNLLLLEINVILNYKEDYYNSSPKAQMWEFPEYVLDYMNKFHGTPVYLAIIPPFSTLFAVALTIKVVCDCLGRIFDLLYSILKPE